MSPLRLSLCLCHSAQCPGEVRPAPLTPPARSGPPRTVSTHSVSVCGGGGCSGPAGGAAARPPGAPPGCSCNSSGQTLSSVRCAGCSGCTSPPAPSCRCGPRASASGAAAADRSAARGGWLNCSLSARREMSLTSLPTDGAVTGQRPSETNIQGYHHLVEDDSHG